MNNFEELLLKLSELEKRISFMAKKISQLEAEILLLKTV